MWSKKNSEAREATRSDALLDGPIRRQRTTGVPRSAVLALEHDVHESPRPADGVAPADARAGADTRPVRLSAAPGVDAARRLAGRQRTLLSRVHRGGLGLATQAAVATRHRGASRATAAGDGPQRHLEHGFRRRRIGRRSTVPRADDYRSVHARMPGDRRRPGPRPPRGRCGTGTLALR